LLVSIFLAVRENIKEFSFIKIHIYIILLLIVIGGAAARFSLVGIYPVVFNDEFLYLSTAENISHTGQASPEVFRGYPPASWGEKKFIPPYPQLWSVAVSSVFKLAGGGDYKTAAHLSFVLSVLTPVLIFFAAFFLFQKALKQNSDRLAQYAGLFAAAFWAFLPVSVKLSGCTAPETASAFFISLFLSIIFLYRLYPTNKTFLASVFSLCAVVHTRPENLLYAIVLLVIFLAVKKKPDKKIAIIGFCILALFAAVSVLIMFSGHMDPVRAKVFTIETRPVFENKWQNMGANLFNNLMFFTGKNNINPILYTILAFIGFVLLFIDKRKEAGRLLGWFVFAWLIFSPFPFGDYSNSNSSDAFRFSLHLYFPMIFVIAYGCSQLERIKLLGNNRILRGVAGVIIIVLCIGSLITSKTFFGFQPVSGRDYDGAREMGIKLHEEKIPAHFVSSKPDICLMLKYGTGFPSSLIETQADIDSMKADNARLFYYTSQEIPELYLKNFQMDVYSRRMDEEFEYSVFELKKIEY
jgi:hypothetical protein